MRDISDRAFAGWMGLVLLCLLAIGFAAGAAFAAGNDKPPSPPGQGECQHGNSGKPCKDDPQPDHGQDCDEHGPKEGGVNEDHCKGETPTTPTETEPTTTETTTSEPTETTPTTPEEPGTTPTPEPPSTSPEPEGQEPSEEGEASKPPKIVKVTPGSTPETVIVHLSDGTTQVGVKGQG